MKRLICNQFSSNNLTISNKKIKKTSSNLNEFPKTIQTLPTPDRTINKSIIHYGNGYGQFICLENS